MSVIDVLAEKSWDMGLNVEKQGDFDSENELLELLKGCYPWSMDKECEKEILEGLLTNEYIRVDSEDIDEISIINNSLYAFYHDYTVLDMFDKVIYDTDKKNFLLAFSNSGWLFVDAAIDLSTGTIGYFNAEENIFTPKKIIKDDDIEMLENIIEYEEIEADWEAEVERVDNVTWI